jgi:hypothetical protein
VPLQIQCMATAAFLMYLDACLIEPLELWQINATSLVRQAEREPFQCPENGIDVLRLLEREAPKDKATQWCRPQKA